MIRCLYLSVNEEYMDVVERERERETLCVQGLALYLPKPISTWSTIICNQRFTTPL